MYFATHIVVLNGTEIPENYPQPQRNLKHKQMSKKYQITETKLLELIETLDNIIEDLQIEGFHPVATASVMLAVGTKISKTFLDPEEFSVIMDELKNDQTGIVFETETETKRTIH